MFRYARLTIQCIFWKLRGSCHKCIWGWKQCTKCLKVPQRTARGINISLTDTDITELMFWHTGGWPADCAGRWHQSTRWQKMLKSILNAMCRKPFWFQFLIHTYMCSVKTRVSCVVETLLIHVHTVLTHENSALCTMQATKTKTKTKTKYTLWTPQANMTYLRSTSPPYTGTQTRLRGGCTYLKMTVRGTMVRSEVCNSWCFCLGS